MYCREAKKPDVLQLEERCVPSNFLVKFDPHEIGMKEVKERMEATNRLKVGTIVQTHTSDRSASPVRLIVSGMLISNDTVFFSYSKTTSAGL